MTITEAEKEARQAWQNIVNHELNAVDFWGQPAHEREAQNLIDDYRIKRNRVTRMQRQEQQKDGMNNWAFAAMVVVVILYIVYKSNFS